MFAVGLGVVALAEAFTRGPSITFLNRDEARGVLAADVDGFIRDLTTADLSARRARTSGRGRPARGPTPGLR